MNDPLQRSGGTPAGGLFDSTSRKAGEAAARVSGKRRLDILAYLRDHGPAAIFEVAVHLGCFDHQISGRFGELERDHLIYKTGQRKTKPDTQCDAELYDLVEPRPLAPTALEKMADRLGYPSTIKIEGETFERGLILQDDLPGIQYTRREAAGLRLTYRVSFIECDGCGHLLKLVTETIAGQPRKTYRCGTPGCQRTWHPTLVHDAGQPQLLALILKHL